MLNKLRQFFPLFLGLAIITALIGNSRHSISKIVNFKKGVLVLSKKNTLVFRSVVNNRTVSTAQAKALELNSALGDSRTPIYLFLDTPGGSVTAGLNFIDTLKALSREVKTVTNFSASMGFQMVQNLGERLITPNGILMSHRAYIGLEGQTPGEFESRAKFYSTMLTAMDKTAASRMKLELSAYKELVRDEYWVSGQEAVTQNAADKMVLVSCDESLSGIYKETIQTLLGNVTISWSECPLISFPVKIDFGDIEEKNDDKEEALQIKELIFKAIYDKNKLATSKEDLLEYLRLIP